MENVDGSGDAVLRVVRIGGAHYDGSVVPTGIDFSGQLFARTKRVFLTNTKRESDFFCGRETCAQ